MTQKRFTISTKINERENLELTKLAERENISISAIMKLFSDALLNGEIELEKGELKICTPPHENCISEVMEDDFLENLRYKELKLDKLASVFDEYGYPDYIVRQQIEQMIAMIRDNGKYNPRRLSSEYGC